MPPIGLIRLKTDYKDLKNLDLKITSNNKLLSSYHLAKNLFLEDIVSMIKFNMIQSSPLVDLSAITTIN